MAANITANILEIISEPLFPKILYIGLSERNTRYVMPITIIIDNNVTIGPSFC